MVHNILVIQRLSPEVAQKFGRDRHWSQDKRDPIGIVTTDHLYMYYIRDRVLISRFPLVVVSIIRFSQFQWVWELRVKARVVSGDLQILSGPARSAA